MGRLEGSEVFRVTGARLLPLRGPGHGDTPRVEEVIRIPNVVLCLDDTLGLFTSLSCV